MAANGIHTNNLRKVGSNIAIAVNMDGAETVALAKSPADSPVKPCDNKVAFTAADEPKFTTHIVTPANNTRLVPRPR